MTNGQSIVGKKIRWITEYDATLSGQTFTVESVTCKPDENNDVEGLPRFTIKNEEGVEFTAFSEELRTVDGSRSVPEGKEPFWRVGGKPVMDIHPDVEAICIEFFETYKEFFE